MNTLEIICRGVKETEALGATLGESLHIGDCVALLGGLGAGKTAFARGVGAALEIDAVCSPTFTISMEHEGRLPLVHMDAYRLQSAEEFLELGLDEAFPRAAVLVEWADKVLEALPESRLELTFREGDNENERIITVQARGGADTLMDRFVKSASVGAILNRPVSPEAVRKRRAIENRPYKEDT